MSNFEIDGQLEQRLARALKLFSATPSFEVLKKLRLAELLPGQPLPAALELKNLEEIVRWADRLGSLEGVSDHFIQTMLTLIEPLVPAEELQPEQRLMPETDERRPAVAAVLAASSSETVQKLTAAFDALRSATRYDELKEQRAGDYWPADQARSPFLECLTFRQLAELRPEILVKKRSVTVRVAAALIAAIERALAASQAKPQVIQQCEPQTKAVIWAKADQLFPLPVHLQATLAFFESQCHTTSNSALARLWSSLPSFLSSSQLIVSWLLTEHDLPLVCRLLNAAEQAVAMEQERAQTQLRRLFSETAPELSGQWQALLTGSGVPFQVLLEPLRDEHFPPFVRDFFGRMLLAACGAREVEARGKRLSGYWTKNHEYCELTLSRISAQQLDGAALARELKIYFPLIETERLIELLG